MAEDSLVPPNIACDPVPATKGRRSGRAKTNPASQSSAAAPRPRARRSSKRAAEPPALPLDTSPAAPVTEVAVIATREPTAEETRQTVETIRQAEQELQGIRSRRDEVARSLSETARQLSELDRRASEVRDQTELREASRTLEGLRGERDALVRSLADASQRIADLKRQAAEAKRLTAFEQEVNESLAGLQADREELVGSVNETARQLAELEQRAEALRRLEPLQQVLDGAKEQITAATQQAAEVSGEVDRASETCQAVSQHVHSVQKDLRAMQEAVDQADTLSRRASEQAAQATAEADQTRQDLAVIEAQMRAAREEAGMLTAEVRQALDELRAGIEEAHLEAAPPIPPPTPATAVIESPPAVEPIAATVPSPAVAVISTATDDSLPEIAPLPDEELARTAGQRLLRYLNDAYTVEKEASELLQEITSPSLDPELRTLLEEHRARTQQQILDIQERLHALHVEPSGGRGLISRIVTRVWDVLQEPFDERDDTIQRLLKAISAAEFEAGLYRTLYALARGFGEPATADLASAHYQQERDFVTRLRERIIPTALRAARKLGAAAPAESTPST